MNYTYNQFFDTKPKNISTCITQVAIDSLGIQRIFFEWFNLFKVYSEKLLIVFANIRV